MMVSVPVFGQFSDKTGLNSRLYVDAGGQEFEVLTTANFQVSDAAFDLDDKRLTLSITGSLEDNLGEITIPKKLLDGELDLVLDGAEYVPQVRSNDKIWFVTVEFNGTGMHTLEITGTESVGAGPSPPPAAPDASPPDGGGGCLIATAAYGSEMSAQVQLLREIRDDTVLQTRSGSAFMDGFNPFYYSFSPTVADWQRQSPAFNGAVKAAIAPLLGSLAILGHADIDSESEMVGYGTGVILISAGTYLSPVIGFLLARGRLFG